MKAGNIFRDKPDASRAEVIEEFLAFPADGVRLERILSRGQASPEDFWYDQAGDEWVLILSGGAEVRLEDEVVRLGVGDWLFIPAHARHRVESTLADTLWLALHTGQADSQ